MAGKQSLETAILLLFAFLISCGAQQPQNTSDFTDLEDAYASSNSLAFTLHDQDSCDPDFSKALSFVTTTPLADVECFSMDQVFGPNANSTSQKGDINYQVYGKENFDPSANFSGVFYHQLSDLKEEEVGFPVIYRLSFFASDRCQQGDSPFVTWTCQVNRNCQMMPFNPKSFVLEFVNKISGDCDLGVPYGDPNPPKDAASSTRGSMKALVAAMILAMCLL